MRVARALVDGAPRLILTDGVTAVVAPAEHDDPLALLGVDGSEWPSIDLDTVDFLPPIARPGKIIAVGLNYVDHTLETGFTAPAAPLTFAKYPSSLTGHGSDILVPDTIATQVDYEVELAVVIGRRCGGTEPATVDDIAAYTVSNDVSARDVQFADGQWTRAKSFDGFTPLGPWLVPAAEVADPHALRLWTTVNGELLQDDSTASLVFDLPALLAYIGRGTTLEPGDIILTGTPAGAGGFRTPPRYLQHGDVVEVGVDGIGRLSNRIQFASQLKETA
ncbi:fumarylacetoacetate hydrolase family protein [Schumannella luteola]